MLKEIDRIIKLPRIGEYSDSTRSLVKEKLKGKTITLRGVQADALYAIDSYKQGFFPIGVGHGKTIISVLSHLVTGSAKSLLFVPSNVVDQLVRVDIPTPRDRDWETNPCL